MGKNTDRALIIAIAVLSGIILAGLIWMYSYKFSESVWEKVSVDGESETVSEALADDMIIVGFSQVGSESVWRTVNTESIENSLSQENGYYLILENGRQRQENQMKSLRNFISQRVDYIIFSPIVQYGWDDVLSEANEAGIPVILVDRTVEKNARKYVTAWIGSDTEKEGRMAGEWLEQYLEEKKMGRKKINIAVLKGTVGSTPQLGRGMGFDKVVTDHPNWEIVASEEGDFTKSLGKEKMEKILDENPDTKIDVLVSQNDDMTLGALEVLKERGISTGVDGDMIVISFDATIDALKLVQEGQINVEIECNPLQGDYVKNLIERLEAGETIDATNYVDENVFTIENVSEYIDDRKY